MSLRSQIEEARDLKEEEYEVPEWGVGGVPCKLLLKEMHGSAAARVLSALRPHMGGVKAKDIDADAVNADMAVVTMEQLPVILHDSIFDPETRELVFPGEDGIAALRAKSSQVMLRIFNRVSMLSGLGADGLDLAKAD